MKRYILFTLIQLVATICSTAQEVDHNALENFIKELRSTYGTRNESERMSEGTLRINSLDEESYQAMSAVVRKYDIYFAEEIFGMQLLLNIREGGEQSMLFQGDDCGMAIADHKHQQQLTFTFVKGSIAKYYFKINNDNTSHILEGNDIDTTDGDAYSSGGNFEIIASVEEPTENMFVEFENIESPLSDDIKLELFDHYMPMIQKLKNEAGHASTKRLKTKTDSIYNVWNNEINNLKRLLENIKSPGIIRIDCTGNMMIVTPKETKKGIYEWINSTGFCRTDGQTTQFITATDVATYYITKQQQPHHTDWSLEGYSDAMTRLLTNEVPGGEPVYMHRCSTTEEGYNTMKNDLNQFFYLNGKDKTHRYKGFKAIERIDLDAGGCFLYLYDGNTIILIYDSPTDKHCQMDIIVGGIEMFNEAVKDISIEGKRGVATNTNIVICDGSIELIEGEAEINGTTHNSGIHFTTGYMKKLN